METNREIKRIKSLLGVSKTLIIEGNINDLYFYNGQYLNIGDILEDMLYDKKFYNVYTYDLSYGVISRNVTPVLEICQKNNIEIKKKETFYNNKSGLQFKSNADFFSVMNELIISNLPQKNSIIMDYSNFIFSDNTLEFDDRKSLTNFYKIMKEQPFVVTEVDHLSSCIIFLTQKINQLPPSLYLDNPDVCVISLSKPTRDERSKFLKIIKPRILVTDIMEEFENIIDACDGWTIKEMTKFSKFTCSYPEKLPFNKIFNIYNYGEKISPWEELDYKKMSEARDFLKSRVIGQDEAIDKVVKVLYKAFTGLTGVTYSQKRSKPKGTLFFVGPTGTGKTELAKAITNFLFNDESNLIRFDMSEYGQDNSDQKLIGAPPGYVGYEGGGQLTNSVKEKPFSVILFDEIEKASPTIFDKFLQILEDGRLTDNTGQTINFSETFIIFTSNIGASEVNPNNPKEIVYKEFIEKVQNHFTYSLNRPELLGRFGNNIVPFNFIKDIRLKAEIIKQKIRPIQIALFEKYKAKLHIKLDEDFLRVVLKSSDERRGGRDLVNSLETNLVDPLSEFIFNNMNKIRPNVEIIPVINENRLDFILR